MARLYPPVTEEVLPAFCLSYNEKGEKQGASIKINFNLNRAVAATDISGIALRLRTISTNQYVVHEQIAENPETGKSEGICITYDLTAGTCLFQITNENNPDRMENLKVGQYYKAQFAFIDNNGDIGYWSTVATIKCIAKPTVSIANYVSNDVNIFTNEIVGEYTQDTTTGDSSEKAYSYRFQLFDQNDNLLDDTGIQLHNSNNDIFSNSSTDTYYCYRELGDDECYYLIYSVTTINGFSISTPKYQIIAAESINPEEDISLVIEKNNNSEWNPEEDGLIKIYPIIESNPTKRITGNFVVLRSSSKDNFKTWQEVRRFRLYNEIPKEKIIYDYTVEQGITYRYAIQQFNRAKFYSKKIINNNDIKADFEDMFLYDGKRQLKIRFNPKVSSFKNSLQEQKIDTIGSKYPFIFRNGNVCYKEFPIAGLISFQEDNSLFFIEKDLDKDTDDYRQMDLARFEQPPRTKSFDNTGLIYNKTDLTSENITSERYFKLLVLDWLTDGKPKIFRSPTEGNYIVRLLNVSLAPKDQLGRMLHEFSCTAYEIADFTYENLIALGLLNPDKEINENENHWYSIDIDDIFNQDNYSIETGYYTIDLHNKKILGFQCTGFYPGDIIKILTANSITQIEIMIGTTGSYIYDEGEQIVSISVLPKIDPGDFSRNILFLTQGYTFQKFDTIAAIKTYTQIGEQLVGPIQNFLSKTVVSPKIGSYWASPNVDLLEDDDGLKLRVTELLHLHAKRREVIPIFYNDETAQTGNGASCITEPYFSLTPFGQGYINGKAIVKHPTWINGANLTDDELEQKRSIKEIVDFCINKCNKDIFCLFEVYAPDNYPGQKWIPYSEKSFTSDYFYNKGFYGIYDPWLYREQMKRVSLYNFTEGQLNSFSYLLGWWLTDIPFRYNDFPEEVKKDGYIIPYRGSYYKPYKDTTITFHYEDGTKNIIDLNEKLEITLDNIKVPTSIDIGNCVVMEPIYRLQCIDYLIENENIKLKALKDKYLQVKNDAIQNINEYNNTLYLRMYGELLLKRYNKDLATANMISSYNDTIDLLVEKARQNQIEKLQSYFSKEKTYTFVLKTQILNSLETIRNSLTYDNSIYDEKCSEIINAKKKYDKFFSQPEKFYNDIPQLLRIKQIKTVDEARNQINDYIYHIQNSSEYNFNTIINNIKNTLSEKCNSIDELLNNLQGKYYVNQYLEGLNQKGIDLFFSEVDEEKLALSEIQPNTQIYELIYKPNADINSLKNTNIISSNWDEYFYLQENDLLTLSIQFDNDTKKYIINNINNNPSFDQNCLINEIQDNGIRNALNSLNNSLSSSQNLLAGNTKEEKEISYYDLFKPRQYDNGKPNKDNIEENQYLLGQFSKDNLTYSLYDKSLEQQINSFYVQDSNITKEYILSHILFNGSKPCPNSLKTLLKIYIKDYITPDNNKLSPRDIYKKIISCIDYYNSYKNELSNDQKTIIKNIINDYYNNPTYYNFITEKTNLIINYFNDWVEYYNDVTNVSSSIQDKYEILNTEVTDFNNIIRYKKDIIRKFNTLREQYISISEQYSNGSNIRDILQNEKEIYQTALNELNDIQNNFNSQLNLQQQNTLLQGYLDFLNIYLISKTDTFSNTDIYYQKLDEARALAATSINENNSPEKQNAEIQIAWKKFLDALAIAYKEEIKERFG